MTLPNGPQAPTLLQLLQLRFNPTHYLEAANRRCPNLFALKSAWNSNHLVIVNHPQALRQMFANETTQFDAPGQLHEFFKPFLGDYSVMTVDGDRHQRQRHLLMPAFHGERVWTYGQQICSLTRSVMDGVACDRPFTARSNMQEIALKIMLEVIFGISDGKRSQRFEWLIRAIFEIFKSPVSSTLIFSTAARWDLGPWSPWGHFLSLKRELDELIYTEIADRRQNPHSERHDILALLMSACDEDGIPMSDVEIRDELLSLLLSGHETTSAILAWALYWVHHLSDVRQRLLAELDALDGDRDPKSLYRLPYLTAVCQETMRIYPVAFMTFPRVVRSPVRLLDCDLDPGTVLLGCIYLTHQREDLYPDPKQFKPERFLERQFSPYEFLPFGGGSRRCIGAALAQMTISLVLATILSNYELELVDRESIRPQVRGLLLVPSGGVTMRLKGKRSEKERQSSMAESYAPLNARFL
ncbi:cytochrome P450 [Pseudanabaena sp. PCC 6802]|uniref:cytochrome P450 n=1 Tax=Pseudanabaena sp. PCC 6802 TaxID=118173 RepID=UPI00034A4FF0|nr:cytochrome P450 [Pseudanabaena sp. PCC 6802]